MTARTRKEVDSDDRGENSGERRETLMTRGRKAVARGRIAVAGMRQRFRWENSGDRQDGDKRILGYCTLAQGATFQTE